MKEIIKIVITGGPCGGKTSALPFIEKHFRLIGYNVITVGESASEILVSQPQIRCGTEEFQNAVMSVQLEKEEKAEKSVFGKTLIVCDRGIADMAAYIDKPSYEKLIGGTGGNIVSARDRYDAVFHMVTAAEGAEKYYFSGGNSVRMENAQQAANLDKRTLAAWVGHNHLRLIDNSTDFNGKVARLISEIEFFLGVPKSLEIERKFLIKYPDTKLLEKMYNCHCVDIQQVYLTPKDGANRRIRKRGENGYYVCYFTEKRKISNIIREEYEKKISEAEYERLMEEADPCRRPITKKRYCLMENGTYFEIDVFPFWKDKAFLEVELLDERQSFVIPNYIRVIRDVTKDRKYTNYALSRKNLIE
ncbi:MAG: AAA family ATPase [Bacillota bacterium]|nr:AAA family ATPase [Bacillota bacterium]